MNGPVTWTILYDLIVNLKKKVGGFMETCKGKLCTVNMEPIVDHHDIETILFADL